MTQPSLEFFDEHGAYRLLWVPIDQKRLWEDRLNTLQKLSLHAPSFQRFQSDHPKTL